MALEYSLISNKDLVLRATEEAIASALEKVGLQAEGYVKMLTPVNTGNLRNSITHAVAQDEKAVYVGTDMYYAPYVEYGTGKYSENSTGGGFWVYVEGSEGSGNHSGKRYTEKEARRIVAILRSKGLKAHMTEGRKPAHMFRDGVEKHMQEYQALFEAELRAMG